MFVFMTAKIVLEVCTLWDCISDLDLCNFLNAEVARGSRYYSSGLIILITSSGKEEHHQCLLTISLAYLFS
jgi:hypothetical protein